ncbi:MAG: glycoside hydrolase family 127 protein, partial [Spirochaetaceae bacterium]|nr:glycoside hydrolase family 127 protein [Spirochaetaceae bacterium]
MPIMFEPFPPSDVQLLDAELLQKRESDRAYLLKLSSDNLLRPYRFEAGLWSQPGKPEDIHWGWESPSSQLRGHVLGHWLSAASLHAAATGDRELRGKAEAIVDGLELCQEANGGEWLGSIPEKYLELIAAGRRVWAPHYTIHKTFMGLVDAYRYIGSSKALELAESWAKWFYRWTSSFSKERMDEILDFETGGMLEIWAELLGFTGKSEYRALLDRYTRRKLFDRLLEGSDPLSNMHANTTIPEVLGAARAYEITGEARWLDIAKAYWELAAEKLPRWATGGGTTGEIWVPKDRLPHRLGETNQELCTVYNMMRLAEFLLRHTGEARYADYWERNLRNGVLAQGFWKGSLANGAKADHPLSGLVSYFLPLRPGSVKLWASETDDFFCCHGTNVQANATHTGGIFYKAGSALAICQLIESRLSWEREGELSTVEIRRVDLAGDIQRIDDVAPAHPAPPDRQVFEIHVSCPRPTEFPIVVRLPWWL